MGGFLKDYLVVCVLSWLKMFSICYRVFIKYCVFLKILKYIPDSRFNLGVSECTKGRPNTSAAAELAEFRKITTF